MRIWVQIRVQKCVKSAVAMYSRNHCTGGGVEMVLLVTWEKGRVTEKDTWCPPLSSMHAHLITCTQPTYTYIFTQKRCTSEPGYDRKVPERGKPFQRLKSLPGFLSSRRGSLPVLPDSRRQEASHKAYVWKCQPLARCAGVKVSGDILTQGHRPSAMAQLSAPPQVCIRQAAGTILPCFHPSEWKQTWRALTWLGRRFPLKRQLLKLVGCGLELQFITVSLIPLPRQKTEHSTYISRPVRGNKV